jgi:hypothetical protein
MEPYESSGLDTEGTSLSKYVLEILSKDDWFVLYQGAMRVQRQAFLATTAAADKLSTSRKRHMTRSQSLKIGTSSHHTNSENRR